MPLTQFEIVPPVIVKTGFGSEFVSSYPPMRKAVAKLLALVVEKFRTTLPGSIARREPEPDTHAAGCFSPCMPFCRTAPFPSVTLPPA